MTPFIQEGLAALGGMALGVVALAAFALTAHEIQQSRERRYWRDRGVREGHTCRDCGGMMTRLPDRKTPRCTRITTPPAGPGPHYCNHYIKP